MLKSPYFASNGKQCRKTSCDSERNPPLLVTFASTINQVAMTTDEIEKQLFITIEEAPTAEKSALPPTEEDDIRKYHEQKRKEREEWDNIIASKDSEFIKCYRKYRHLLNVNRGFFDRNCWELLFVILDKLKLGKKYVLDDYRSKTSTNNILKLYARNKNTPRPTERQLEEWEYCNPSGLFALVEMLMRGDKQGVNGPKDMPPMILPHEVITLDFDALSIWQAYLLRITDYFIGQRWHGNYHKMNIIFDPMKDIRIFFMREEERMKYVQQLEALNPDYEPYIIINGNKAKVRHLALIGDTRITECICTITYNPKTRKIEKFEFDDSEMIKIPRVFWY